MVVKIIFRSSSSDSSFSYSPETKYDEVLKSASEKRMRLLEEIELIGGEILENVKRAISRDSEKAIEASGEFYRLDQV